MTNLQKMQAIQDAHAILFETRTNLSNGSMSVWRIIDHATKHLNQNMLGLLGEDQVEQEMDYQLGERTEVSE